MRILSLCALLAASAITPALAQIAPWLPITVAPIPAPAHSAFDPTVTGAWTYSTTNAANDTATCSTAGTCSSNGNFYWAVGTASKNTGFCYLEFKMGAGFAADVGFTNSANAPYAAKTSVIGTNAGGVSFSNGGSLNNAGGGTVNGYPTFNAANAVAGLAIDYVHGLVWMRNSGTPGTWNLGAGAAPGNGTSGTGGVNISGIVSTGMKPAIDGGFFGNFLGPATINTGQTAFAATIPAGYSACY